MLERRTATGRSKRRTILSTVAANHPEARGDTRDGLCLAFEALLHLEVFGKLRGQDLHGHRSIQVSCRQLYKLLPFHPRQWRNDLAGSESGACLQGHDADA
jgi:hypothetical protein